MAVDLHTATDEYSIAAGSGAGRQVLAFAEVFLISVWLGSMIFFSFAVAPSAFAVLPTRELAGAIVTSTISKIEILGLAIGPLLLMIQAINARTVRVSTGIKLFKLILVVIMIVTAALSHFWISARMVSVRAAMGGHIDDVALTDPMRVQFNDLHQYSVALMSTAMLAGIVLLFLVVRSWLAKPLESTRVLPKGEAARE
ncbi:MAG: DUF4149 domain-containing protein [Blastocatellia bacterium]